MPQPERARWTAVLFSRPPGRRAWPLAVVTAIIALLAACSAGSGSAAAGASSPGGRAIPAASAAPRTVPMTVVRHGPGHH